MNTIENEVVAPHPNEVVAPHTHEVVAPHPCEAEARHTKAVESASFPSDKTLKRFALNCLSITKEMAVQLEKETGKKVYLYSLDTDWTDTMIGNKRCAIRGEHILFSSQTVVKTALNITEALSLFRLVCPECDIDLTGRSIVMISDYIPMQSKPHSQESGKQESGKQSRSILNELSQKYKIAHPVYVTRRSGPDNQPTFQSMCAWDGRKGQGTGNTKKDAEEQAARNVLTKSSNMRAKDLTIDGDIESNPGPIIQQLVVNTTSPFTWTTPMVAGDVVDCVTLTVGSTTDYGTLRVTGNAIDFQVVSNPNSTAQMTMNTTTPVTSSTMTLTDTTGSGTSSGYVTIGYHTPTTSPTSTPVTITGQPVWITEYRQENVPVTKRLPNDNKPKYRNRNAKEREVNLEVKIQQLEKTISEIHAREEKTSTVLQKFKLAYETARAQTNEVLATLPRHIELKRSIEFPPFDDHNLMPNNIETDPILDLTTHGDVESNPGPITEADFFAPKEFDLDAFRKAAVSMGPSVPKFIQADPFAFESEISEPQEPPVEQHRPSLEQYHAHILHMADHSGKQGGFFKTLALSLGLDPENRFSLLTLDETFPLEPSDEVDSRPVHRSPKPRLHEDKPPKSIPKPQVAKPIPLTQEEKEKVRHSVIRRIVEKLESDITKIIAWLSKPMTTKFKIQICDALFGCGWQSKPDMHQYEFWAYCDLNNVSTQERSFILAQYDLHFPEYSHLFQQHSGSDEADALLHNKLVHAYNGNPVSQTFSEVKQMPSWMQVLSENNDVMPTQRGLELQSFITNVDGEVNPNLSSLSAQDRLRGNQVTAANAIIQNAVVGIPNTNLIPRQLRPVAAGAAVNTARRLPVTVVNVAEYYSNPIQATQLSKDMSMAVANNQTSNWRRDNTSLAGFSMFDCFSENSIVTPKGLSLESMLLKLDLLHSTLSNSQSQNFIPNSVYNAIDSRSIPALGNPILGINDSPIANEQCGGNAPVYPYGGGTGTIFFHLTLQSVPIERRDDAIFMPPALLMASIDAQQAIALFAMSFSEYPFGIYTVTKPTTDTAGGNPGNTIFVPTSSLVRVPGQQILDIILPRRYAEQNPTAQPAANTQAVIQPQTGPVASAALAAGVALNVNFVGQAPVGYNLTDYLYTWATAFDTTTLGTYMWQLAVLIGIKDSLEAVHEMTVSLTQMFPSLVSAATQVTALPAFDTVASMTLNYLTHGRAEPATVAFPQPATLRSNYRIFETNISAWNKVILGLAQAPNLASEGSFAVPEHIASPKNNMWERLLALTFAGSWASYYNMRGFTTEAWNTGYTNNQMRFIQNTVRFTFCTAADNGSIIPARYTKYVNNAYKLMYHKGMKKVTAENLGGETRDITTNDRWLPHQNYAMVFDITGAIQYTGMIPTILIDIWTTLPTKDVILNMAAFPPPAGPDSTQGFSTEKGLSVHRNMTLGLVAPYVDTPVKPAYDLDKGPAVTSESRWNERLWFTQPVRQILDYAGNALPAALVFVPQNFYPMQRILPLNAGENNPVGVTCANTTCLAVCDSNGLRILPYLTQANATVPINACVKSSRLARDAWLLDGIMSEPTLQAISGQRDVFEEHFKPSDFRPSAATETASPPTAVIEQAVPQIASNLSLEVSPTTQDTPTSSSTNITL